MSVTVGGEVVLNHEDRLIVQENQVGNVPPLLGGIGSVDLLQDQVVRGREWLTFSKAPIDLLDEDFQERVPEVVRALRIQQPPEDIGQLLLVGPMVHHIEDIESRLRRCNQYRKQLCRQIDHSPSPHCVHLSSIDATDPHDENSGEPRRK
jgi:hypothetical protein